MKAIIRTLLLGVALGSSYSQLNATTFEDYTRITLAVVFTILAARE